MEIRHLNNLNLESILEDLNNLDVVSIDTLQLILWGADASSTYMSTIGSVAYEQQNAFIEKIEKAIKARTYK